MTTAVIVEDDILASMALSELLEGEGFSVRAFSSADEAYSSCLESPPQLLIVDWCIPGKMSSRELAEDLKRRHKEARIIFITGYSAQELPEDLGESEYFSKPLNFDCFLSDIRAGKSAIQQPHAPSC